MYRLQSLHLQSLQSYRIGIRQIRSYGIWYDPDKILTNKILLDVRTGAKKQQLLITSLIIKRLKFQQESLL